MEEFKVAEPIAVSEVKAFIEYHLDEEIDEVQVAKDYRDVVKAVMRGRLNIENPNEPVLTLKEKVLDENKSPIISEITFLTRIPATVLSGLAKGIDLQKDSLTFANKMTAYYIQQPAVAMLNKFGKTDYKVIQQIVGLF